MAILQPNMSAVEFDGPDLNVAPVIEQAIEWLDGWRHNPAAYIVLWNRLADVYGIRVDVVIDVLGVDRIWLGLAADGQERARSIIANLLRDHLLEAGHREALIAEAKQRFRFRDDRPNDPRETTRVMRRFLAAGSKILVQPDGCVSENGTIPKARRSASDESHAAMEQADRDWFMLRCRHRATRQIARTARALGERLDNGWIVLSGRDGL